MTTKHPAGIVAMLMLIVGLFFGYLIGVQRVVTTPSGEGFSPCPGTQVCLTYQLMVDYGNDVISSYNDLAFNLNETVFSALERQLKIKNIEFESREYNGLGMLVTKIGSQESGSGKKYWQYWVNGKHPDVGADKYLLKPGDVVEWKFTSATES